MRIFFAVLLVLSVAVGLSCKKKKSQNVNNNPVPSVPIDMTIYPGDPIYYKVQAPAGWMYITGGINGIILYRKSNEEFVAIERTSPQLPDNAKAKVWVMADNFSLIDSVSGSRWRIFDGTVTKGPAQWPMRLYGTTYDGNVLKIRN